MRCAQLALGRCDGRRHAPETFRRDGAAGELVVQFRFLLDQLGTERCRFRFHRIEQLLDFATLFRRQA
jgi:hypothetical protein